MWDVLDAPIPEHSRWTSLVLSISLSSHHYRPFHSRCRSRHQSARYWGEDQRRFRPHLGPNDLLTSENREYLPYTTTSITELFCYIPLPQSWISGEWGSLQGASRSEGHLAREISTSVIDGGCWWLVRHALFNFTFDRRLPMSRTFITYISTMTAFEIEPRAGIDGDAIPHNRMFCLTSQLCQLHALLLLISTPWHRTTQSTCPWSCKECFSWWFNLWKESRCSEFWDRCQLDMHPKSRKRRFVTRPLMRHSCERLRISLFEG